MKYIKYKFFFKSWLFRLAVAKNPWKFELNLSEKKWLPLMGFSKYRYVFKNANFINNKAQVQEFYKKHIF